MQRLRRMQFSDDPDDLRVSVWVRTPLAAQAGKFAILAILAVEALIASCILFRLQPEVVIFLAAILASVAAYLIYLSGQTTTKLVYVYVSADQLEIVGRGSLGKYAVSKNNVKV